MQFRKIGEALWEIPQEGNLRKTSPPVTAS